MAVIFTRFVHILEKYFKKSNVPFSCLHLPYLNIQGIGEYWKVMQTLKCMLGFHNCLNTPNF